MIVYVAMAGSEFDEAPDEITVHATFEGAEAELTRRYTGASDLKGPYQPVSEHEPDNMIAYARDGRCEPNIFIIEKHEVRE